MSTSAGQADNENPLELKLNLLRTRFIGKTSRSVRYARTTTQNGFIIPSQRYLIKVWYCSRDNVFTGFIWQRFKCRLLPVCNEIECRKKPVSEHIAQVKAWEEPTAVLDLSGGDSKHQIRYHCASFLRSKLRDSVKNSLRHPHHSQ